MSISPDLHRHIQHGPPNMLNLADMFRELIASADFSAALVLGRQGMYLLVERRHVESLLMPLAGKESSRPEEQGGLASLYYIQPGAPSSGSGESDNLMTYLLF
jgi:hypothetical protein